MKIIEFREHALQMLKSIYEAREAEAITKCLLSDILHLDFSHLSLNGNQELSASEERTLSDAIPRLLQFEPVQYVTGKAYFMNLELQVNEHVLIPRPETEELVEWIISEENQSSSCFLDLGTGSGCIIISLAKSLSGSVFYASDISRLAIEVAKQNAIKHDVNVHFLEDDFMNPKENKYPKADVIVSNPPYIPVSDMNILDRNVLDYEPHIALFSLDHDPISHYKCILNLADQVLNEGGKIYFELHEDFSADLVDYLKINGFEDIRIKRDLQGKMRMLCASKALHNA